MDGREQAAERAGLHTHFLAQEFNPCCFGRLLMTGEHFFVAIHRVNSNLADVAWRRQGILRLGTLGCLS